MATRGTLALYHPAATTTAAITGVGMGDILELPGSNVSGLSLSGTSLTVTTNVSTYLFTNFDVDSDARYYKSFVDSSTGLVAIQFLANSKSVSKGDFNGDGEADILWRNTSGDTYIWNSNSSGGFAGVDLGIVDTSWQIAGTGDFNGDGKADILWRNTSGDTYIWNSNSSGVFAGIDLGIVDKSWQIAGTGDFNGDGKADILWRNTSGDTYIWNSNSSGGFAGVDLGIVDTSWQIAGTGDFNGDGKADILWKNTSGDTYISKFEQLRRVRRRRSRHRG